MTTTNSTIITQFTSQRQLQLHFQFHSPPPPPPPPRYHCRYYSTGEQSWPGDASWRRRLNKVLKFAHNDII